MGQPVCLHIGVCHSPATRAASARKKTLVFSTLHQPIVAVNHHAARRDGRGCVADRVPRSAARAAKTWSVLLRRALESILVGNTLTLTVGVAWIKMSGGRSILRSLLVPERRPRRRKILMEVGAMLVDLLTLFADLAEA